MKIFTYKINREVYRKDPSPILEKARGEASTKKADALSIVDPKTNAGIYFEILGKASEVGEKKESKK